jgi:hypothetical protein
MRVGKREGTFTQGLHCKLPSLSKCGLRLVRGQNEHTLKLTGIDSRTGEVCSPHISHFWGLSGTWRQAWQSFYLCLPELPLFAQQDIPLLLSRASNQGEMSNMHRFA